MADLKDAKEPALPDHSGQVVVDRLQDADNVAGTPSDHVEPANQFEKNKGGFISRLLKVFSSGGVIFAFIFGAVVFLVFTIRKFFKRKNQTGYENSRDYPDESETSDYDDDEFSEDDTHEDDSAGVAAAAAAGYVVGSTVSDSFTDHS